MRKLNPNLVHRAMFPKEMSATSKLALVSALVLAFGAAPALAQSDIRWDPPAYGRDPYRPVAVSGYVSPREVESLVAPIALFPDNLVAQILMASTYPYDVEDAADWVGDPRNARLVGYALSAALDDMNWDPSVKALTSAPDVLRMMDERRDWTARLGQAFMADQGMVMDAVQHLRRQARAAGRLYPDRYRRIVDRGGEIIIEPVSASEMYVQFYDPMIAFGGWAYPDFPPYYFPRVYYDVVRPIPIITPLWGWSSWDWRGRHLRVDPGRWRQLNHNRPNVIIGNTWRHDPGRNQGREFRGGMDRTNFGPRPGFNGGPDRDGNDRRGNDRRDNDRRDGSRFGAPPQADANPNPSFHGRGPGLNQDNPQRWRDRGTRDGNDRTSQDRGRQEANVNPVAPAQPEGSRDRFNGRGFGGFDRQQRRERGEGRPQQETNVSPTPVPQAQPAPVPQPDQNRFDRGNRPEGRGEGRGWQQREQVNIVPTPQPQAQPEQRQWRGNEQANMGAPNGGGDFRGRGGRFGGGQPAPVPQAVPQAAPQQPQPQAQPQTDATPDGQQRRFHGRGRGDDPSH